MPQRRVCAKRQNKGTNDKSGGSKVIQGVVENGNQDGCEEVEHGGENENVIQHEGEIVIPDGGGIAIEDGGSGAEVMVPREIWFEILTLIIDSYPNGHMVNKRLVCKLWRDLIDENMLFQVTLNDQKIDVGNTMSHIRAKSCVIISLLKPILPHELVLREPERLKKLCLWGPISLRNMVYFARRFINVKNLHLSGAAFAYRSLTGNFLTSSSNEETIVLANLFGRLEKLELSGIRLRQDEQQSKNEICRILLRQGMPMLKSFIIGLDLRKTSFESSIDDVILFISRHPGIKLLSLQAQSDEHRHTMNANITQHFQGVNLETLRLHIDCPVKFRYLIPLIQRQTDLKELRVRARIPQCISLEFHEVLGYFLWNEVLECLAETMDRKNLVSLEIDNFQILGNLNMASFQGQNNLKKLILTKSNLAPYVEAINLALLPDSLEYLKLTNLSCATYDLEMLFNNNNAPNLKCLELNPAGRDYGFGIDENCLRSLLRKEKMKSVSLNHINLTRFEVQVLSGKRYVVLDNFKILVKDFCPHHLDCCSFDVDCDTLGLMPDTN